MYTHPPKSEKETQIIYDAACLKDVKQRGRYDSEVCTQPHIGEI